MTLRDARTEIGDVEALTALLGEPTEAARRKAGTSLADVDVAWLRSSPVCVVATALSGGCDASPKGDPDLVHVVDERTTALAERPGNRRADGSRTTIEHPGVGLLFLRSRLRDPATWDPEAKVPRRAALAHQHENTVEELDEYDGPTYAESTYRNAGV